MFGSGEWGGEADLDISELKWKEYRGEVELNIICCKNFVNLLLMHLLNGFKVEQIL